MKRLYDSLSGCKKEEDEASFVDTKDYSKFYSSKSDRYDWDRAPSTPCPSLVADVFAFLSQRRKGDEEAESTSLPYIYDLTNRGSSDARRAA